MSFMDKLKNGQFVTGIVILGVIVLLTLTAPWTVRYDPDIPINPAQNHLQKPSAAHQFGTDQFGRDVLARVLSGGRVSLFIGLSVVLLSVLLGLGYGAVSGYVGGLLDQILMRLVDLFLSFPILFITVTCMALLGSGMTLLIVVLVLTGWMDIARLVRAEVCSLKERPFILNARAGGIGPFRIIGSHLLPNVLITVITFSVIRLADIILIESALSFIGLGVQPPTASWGSIIGDGRMVLSSAWWITLFPGLAICLTILSLNLIGNGLKTLNE